MIFLLIIIIIFFKLILFSPIDYFLKKKTPHFFEGPEDLKMNISGENPKVPY